MSLPPSADDFQPENQQARQADEAGTPRLSNSPDPYMTPAEAHALLKATRGSTLTRFLDRAEPVLAYIRDHWLGIINTGLALYIGISLLTPLTFAAGLTGPASGIFNAYRFFCAQTPSHSFFIAGYQTCLCSRCLAIYTSILVAGVALTVFRNNRVIRALPWYYWLLGMVPMALDGFTQLFGVHESNLALRLLTGTIFGLATAWFLFPQIEEAAHQEQPAPNPAAYAVYAQLDH